MVYTGINLPVPQKPTKNYLRELVDELKRAHKRHEAKFGKAPDTLLVSSHSPKALGDMFKSRYKVLFIRIPKGDFGLTFDRE